MQLQHTCDFLISQDQLGGKFSLGIRVLNAPGGKGGTTDFIKHIY